MMQGHDLPRRCCLWLLCLLCSSTLASAQDVTTGLILDYRFNQSSGSAVDSSSSASTGTLNGGAAYVTGKYGNGLQLSANTDYVVVANESTYDFDRTSPFSLAAWLKPTTSNTGGQQIISKVTDASLNGWEWQINTQGTSNVVGKMVLHLWATWNTNVTHVSSTNTLAVNDGAWHHYVWTYSGSGAGTGVKLYQDGTSVPVTVDNDTMSPNSLLNNNPVNVGARSGGSNLYHEVYTGILDDVRVYNRELTAADVAALAALNTSPPTTAIRRRIPPY